MKHASIDARTILAVGAAVALTTTVVPARSAPSVHCGTADTNGNPAAGWRTATSPNTTKAA
jgi:hypothetical protein